MGWIKFTEADWLAYGNSHKNIFHMIKMQDVRDYIESHDLERKSTSDGSVGFIVPVSAIPHQII